MELRDRVNAALKDAMRAKEADRLSTLRLINAAIKDKEIAGRGEGKESAVSDDDILAILGKMTKQRQESARAYEEGSRLDLAEREHDWNHRIILRNLFNAIRMRTKIDFMSYCMDLAERRQEEGFTGEELVGALETIDQVCVRTLLNDVEAEDMKPHLYACISMTIRFGIDQVLEVYERDHKDVDRVPYGAV